MDDAWRYIFQCVYYVSTYKAMHRLWSYSNFYCIVCQRQLSFLYCFWPKQTRWLIANCIIVNTLHVWDYFVKSNLSLLVTTVTWSVTVPTIGFYPHDAMLARVCATATCLSVRLSVTSRYCVKTKKASVMISSTSGSPKDSSFLTPNLITKVWGVPPERGPQRRVGRENSAIF